MNRTAQKRVEQLERLAGKKRGIALVAIGPGESAEDAKRKASLHLGDKAKFIKFVFVKTNISRVPNE
jgi:hypothetical protein